MESWEVLALIIAWDIIRIPIQALVNKMILKNGNNNTF